jgi:hypothetical protein
MGALGSGGSLIAGAALMLLLISAVFAQQGWPGLGGSISRVELVGGAGHVATATSGHARSARTSTVMLSRRSTAPPPHLVLSLGQPVSHGVSVSRTDPAIRPTHKITRPHLTTPTVASTPPPASAPAPATPEQRSPSGQSPLAKVVGDTTTSLQAAVTPVSPQLGKTVAQVGTVLDTTANNLTRTVDSVLQGVGRLLQPATH